MVSDIFVSVGGDTDSPASCSRYLGPVRAAYRVAGRRIVFDRPVAPLAPFADHEYITTGPDSPDVPEAGPIPQPFVRSSAGFVAGRLRDVTSFHGTTGCRVDVEDVGSFYVANRGNRVGLLEIVPDCSSQVIDETLVGPVLILALAFSAAWCLHASAVSLPGGAAAFVGESGLGKSTLADYLAADGGLRLADDVLPVTAPPANLFAMPCFPQLKIPPDWEASNLIPEQIPLTSIYVLAEAPAEQAEPSLVPLGPREAALQLVQHTVASRLFAPALMQSHLAFCIRAAARLPVRLLRYQRRWEALPGVRDLVFADLEAIKDG